MKLALSAKTALAQPSLLVVVLLSLVACSKDVPEPAANRSAAIDTITQQALEEHLAYLADDARPTWNEGDFSGEKFAR
jgi:hypothetical protein